MRTKILLLVLVCAAVLWCGRGNAEAATCHTITFLRVGVWDAFGGPCDDGTTKCGMSTAGEGKYFSVDYFTGASTVEVQLGSRDWEVRDGGKYRVRLEIDKRGPWRVTATGFHFPNGDGALWFYIRKDELGQFLNEIHDGYRLAVWFPGSDVPGWTGGLAGSDKVSLAFARCVGTQSH